MTTWYDIDGEPKVGGYLNTTHDLHESTYEETSRAAQGANVYLLFRGYPMPSILA